MIFPSQVQWQVLMHCTILNIKDYTYQQSCFKTVFIFMIKISFYISLGVDSSKNNSEKRIAGRVCLESATGFGQPKITVRTNEDWGLAAFQSLRPACAGIKKLKPLNSRNTLLCPFFRFGNWRPKKLLQQDRRAIEWVLAVQYWPLTGHFTPRHLLPA